MALQSSEHLTYGFLDVTDGVRYEGQPLGAAVLPAPRHAARNRVGDTLCLLLELDGPQPIPPTLYRDVIAAIADAYFLHPGSITAGLRAAIAEANAALLRENTGPEPRTVAYGAVTCAVWHGNEVIIAQAGPAQAAMVRAGRLERYPPPPVPGTASARPMLALGQARNLDPAFFYTPVRPGDRLCLLSGLPAEPGSEALIRALSHADPEAVLDGLAWLAGEGNVSAVLVVGAQPTEDGGRKTEGRGSSVLRLSPVLRRLSALLNEWLPQARPRGERPPPAWRGRPAPLGLLLLIAILVPALVSFVTARIYIERQRDAQFADLLTQAQAEVERARTGGADPQAARPHWEAALAWLEAAAALRGDDPALAELRAQAQGELDRMDRVIRVHPVRLREFRDGAPTRVFVRGIEVYTLDTQADALYRDVLNQERTDLAQAPAGPLIFKGQAVSAQVLGELVEMAWLPPAASLRTETLAVLDANGALVIVAPGSNELRAQMLPDPGRPLGQVRAMAGFQGNLYLLDAEGGQIWRYEGREAVFSLPPRPYFDQARPELNEALDLAIEPDGAVFVLRQDGEVLRFFGGNPLPFNITGLSQPLGRPVALFLSPGPPAPSLYIADAGEQRIIHLSLSGVYLGQIKADGGAQRAAPLQGLSGLFVDEAGQRLFFTNGQGLFMAELPSQ